MVVVVGKVSEEIEENREKSQDVVRQFEPLRSLLKALWALSTPTASGGTKMLVSEGPWVALGTSGAAFGRSGEVSLGSLGRRRVVLGLLSRSSGVLGRS